MDRGFATVVGMSIAYVASFLGMWMAWYGWKRRHVTGQADPVNFEAVRGIADEEDES